MMKETSGTVSTKDQGQKGECDYRNPLAGAVVTVGWLQSLRRATRPSTDIGGARKVTPV